MLEMGPWIATARWDCWSWGLALQPDRFCPRHGNSGVQISYLSIPIGQIGRWTLRCVLCLIVYHGILRPRVLLPIWGVGSSYLESELTALSILRTRNDKISLIISSNQFRGWFKAYYDDKPEVLMVDTAVRGCGCVFHGPNQSTRSRIYVIRKLLCQFVVSRRLEPLCSSEWWDLSHELNWARSGGNL